MDKKNKRMQNILALFQHKEFLTVQEIVARVGYSAATIRRDILELERKRLIIKKFGGILRHNRNIAAEPTWQQKGQEHLVLKHKIATKARELVAQGNVSNAGSVVFLDAGSTCLALAEELQTIAGIQIVTVDFRIAYFFIDKPLPLFFVGGMIDKTSQSASGNLHGDILRSLNIDIAFISCDAWSLQQGVTSPSWDKVLLKSSVMKSSIVKILVADSAKYRSHSLYTIARLQDFSLVITDNQLAPEAVVELRQQKVNLQLG